MSTPLDQSIQDLLRGAGMGPLLERPVGDVLRSMGLPALPEIAPLPPLPDLPPLPVLDLAALAKPLTDLASGFGTGQFGVPAAPGVGAPEESAQAPIDPTKALAQVSSVVQMATQMGMTAVQAVLSLWQGMGAGAAETTAAQAASDSAAVSAQSAATSAGVGSAAGTVFRGGAAMSAIIAKYLTSLTAASPFLVTPPGQAFILAMTAETLAEATAVVAETRGELTVHSSAMAATGAKVPVANAPSGIDPTQMASQLLGMLPTVLNTATTGAKAIAETVQSQTRREDLLRSELAAREPGPGRPGVAMAGGPMGLHHAWGSQPAPRPLTPFAAAPNTVAGAAGTSPGSSGTRSGAATPGPGYMPMGGAGAVAPRGSGAGAADSEVHASLVAGHHGNDVVGDVAETAPAVVGMTDRLPGLPRAEALPDKELTL